MQGMINTDFKLGVLGGGQLGKMMAQVAQKWSLPLWILDQDPSFPAGTIAHHFQTGSFKSEQDVLDFGRKVDVLTIEIEHVHIGALEQLKSEGKIIHANPSALAIIKDKGLQKAFYHEKGLPTSSYQLFESGEQLKQAIRDGKVDIPFVQKTRTAGYDGKGVAIIRTEADMDKILPPACLIEPLVPIQKELAVIVARNESGEIKAFPPVEMVFHPEANLVEFLVCPARISPAIAEAAEEIAVETIKAFDICGLLAVELFLDQEDRILINEVAPRPHNSGHHTIESCYTSQFEQHLRGVLNLPLGETTLQSPAVMVNLLGAPDAKGKTIYEGFSTAMAVPGAHLHLYGKTQTKPFRKMGHATILADSIDQAMENARKIQSTLKITA